MAGVGRLCQTQALAESICQHVCAMTSFRLRNQQQSEAAGGARTLVKKYSYSFSEEQEVHVPMWKLKNR